MTIYEVNGQLYSNYDQACLNAEKLGLKVIVREVIESDEPELEIKNEEEIHITFENGDTFRVLVELEDELEYSDNDPECVEQVVVKEINEIDIILEYYKKSIELYSSKITDELKKEIEYYAERIKDKTNENLDSKPFVRL